MYRDLSKNWIVLFTAEYMLIISNKSDNKSFNSEPDNIGFDVRLVSYVYYCVYSPFCLLLKVFLRNKLLVAMIEAMLRSLTLA